MIADGKNFKGMALDFCVKHEVKVVDMAGKYKPIPRSKKFYKDVVDYHHFYAGMFLVVIDR